jgi:hypothetical protein
LKRIKRERERKDGEREKKRERMIASQYWQYSQPTKKARGKGVLVVQFQRTPENCRERG